MVAGSGTLLALLKTRVDIGTMKLWYPSLDGNALIDE